MKKNTMLILFMPALSLQACASTPEGRSYINEPSVSQSQKMSLEKQIRHCQKDLASTLQIDPALITTVSIEPVTWRSGAIGCPSPGEQYTQALVPGTRIVLEANGTRYNYHAGANSIPFYCPRPKNKKPTPLYQDR